MTTLEVGNRRLLKLADHLFTVDAQHRRKGEPLYDQTVFEHDCNTPACALGHARSMPAFNREGIRGLSAYDIFKLSNQEWLELFAPDGCGNAQTGKEAARYIRAFVKWRARK